MLDHVICEGCFFTVILTVCRSGVAERDAARAFAQVETVRARQSQAWAPRTPASRRDNLLSVKQNIAQNKPPTTLAK